MSELALLCRKLFPTTSQESGRPRENVDADNEFRPLCINGRCSLAIQCSCACGCLLRFCTSSRFGKFVSVNSLGLVALLATVRALCSLTSQVLELYRLNEIIVTAPSFLSTQFTSLYFVKMFCNTVLPSGCCSPTVSSRLRAAFLRRSITVGRDECLPCLHIGDGVASFLQSSLERQLLLLSL